MPATAFAVLGLLTFGEMSGYDLTKLVERSIGNFFSPAKSHIYSELRRLVALGYAREREVAQRDRPDKRLYRITPGGERALRAWLAAPEVEPEQLKSPFLLRLFFGAHADRDVVRARMKEYRRRAEESLAAMRAIEPELAGREDVRFPYYTLRAGLAHCRAGIRWADEVLRDLGEEDPR